MPDEAMLLKAYGELPEKIKLNDPVSGGTYGGGGGNEELDDNIDFQDEDCGTLFRYVGSYHDGHMNIKLLVLERYMYGRGCGLSFVYRADSIEHENKK